MRRLPRLTVVGCAFALALAACEEGATARDSVGSQLTRGLDFPVAQILNGNLPAPTDDSVVLLPLGGDALASPGVAGLMALEVDDPKGRAPSALLLQFPDTGEYLKAPDDGEDEVVEVEFSTPEEVCEGLCNTYYAIEVLVSVELEGGGISPPVPQTVIIDCTEHGDPDACGMGVADGGIAEGLLCGSLPEGELVISGIPALDRYFGAVRQVPTATSRALARIDEATAELALALGLPADSTPAAVGDELATQIMASTQDGVNATIGTRGCGVVSKWAVVTLGSCDPETTPATEIDCLGLCEPKSGGATCASGTTSGCYGLVEESACDGTCVGACATALGMPTACDGTCTGTCSGSCPDDGMGGCDGPCSGDCTGTCTNASTGTCAEDCTGLCSEDTAAACTGMSRRTCTATEAPASCTGVCFDEPSIADASALCELDALSLARMFPRCDSSLVQLSFAFPMGLSPAEQTAFATLSADLAAPLGLLVDAIARAETVAFAAGDLENAVEGAAGSALDDALLDPPAGTDPVCAESAMLDAPDVLGDALDALGAALNEVSGLLADPITVVE